MANLTATIGITDNLTSPLRNIANAISSVTANLGDIATASGKLDPKKFSAMQSAAQALDRSVSELEEETEKATQAQNRHNKAMQEGESVSGKLSGGFKSLAGAVAGVVAGYASWQTVSAAIDLSDTLSQTTSRLNLINDGMQTTGELQQKIFEAAQNSRGSYQDMADMVSRLGTNAKDAFSSNDEMVRFAEQLNKQFVLAGASADEMAAASLQLTQGLASGTLRGDELNSVMEQAPTVIQTIADSLGVTTGEIRDMAAEGQITADVVKNALLNATDETNAKFSQMSLTFDQVWTSFQNQALMAFQPVLESINGIANDPALTSGISRMGEVITALGPSIASVVESVGRIVPVGLNALIDSLGWIIDNGPMVVAGLSSIATAITAVNVANKVQDAGGFAKIFSGLGDKAGAILALISPMNLLIGAIAGVAAAAVYLVATGTSLTDVIGFFNNLESSIADAAQNITAGITSMAEGFAQGFPAFAAQVGAMIPTIVEGILSSAGAFIDAGAQLAVSLLNGLMTALPSLITGGISMVTNVITGMISMIPRLADQALTIVENFLGALSDNLPNMLQKGGEAIVAFVNGIYAQRETILQAGISAITAFVQTIGEHLPTLIEQGMNLLANLITGIVSMLPQLAAAAVSLIMNLGMYIIQNLPQIILAGVQIVGALASGILQSIPVILSGLGSLFTSFFEALAQYGPQILTQAGEIASNLWNGFVNGLTSGWEQLTSYLSETFNNVISFVKGIFGIASPSTVFQEIGGFLMQGLGNGIQAMWDGISGTIGAIGDTIKGFLTPDVDYAEMIENTRNQITQLQNDIQSGYDTIKDVTLAKGQEMADGTIAIFAQMSAGVLSAVADMAGQINGQLAVIASSFAGIFAAIREQALTYLITLSADAVAQIGTMIGMVSETLSGLTGVFGAAFIAVTASVIGQLAVMQAGSIATLQGLASAAFAVLEAIRVSAVAVITSMSVDFVGAITTMSLTTQSVVTAMAAVVTGVIVGMSVALLAEANVFAVGYIGVWNLVNASVISVVTQMSVSLRNLITTLVNDIIAIANALPTAFYTIGQNMMDDLAGGIKSQTQAVVDVTSQLVEKIKQVFITGLGIHSPSAVLRYYAEMAGAGWIEGLDSSQMVSFTQSIMDEMKGSFKNGKFEPAQLVQYLDEDTLKVISYLNETGDQTTSDQGAGSSASFTNPLIGGPYDITSWFGPRPASDTGGIGSTNHGGIDIGAPSGTQIVAALPGVVTTAGWYDGYGNAVEIDHGGGLTSLYGHMSAVQTSVGATVQAGEAIGLVGSTGNSTGPHLHLSMFQNGTAIDPYPYYEGSAQISGAKQTLATVIQNAYNLAKGITTQSAKLGDIQYDVSAGASQWTDIILQALQIIGQPASLLGKVLATLDKESSGNPNAINDWDSNAMAGTPSKGLMQVIDPTFATYALPGYDTNIWDPLSNILASLNYQLHAYGNIDARLNGYASGTSGATKGLHWVGENGPELLQFAGGERVYPHNQSLQIADNLTFSIPAGNNGATVFDPSLYQINYGASEGSYVDTGAYTPVSGGTTTYQTNNAPINFQMQPTINTREEFELSVAEVESKMTRALYNVLANNATGLHH